MLFLLWFANYSVNRAFAWAPLAPHTRERARVDSPTSARRTAWVCRVAVRPRVPPCAGERSGKPIWIPAHRASCRADRTLLSATFQKLLRLCSAITRRRRKKGKSVKDDFSSHTCLSAGGSLRPVAIPEKVSGCLASVLKLFSRNSA